MTAPPVDAELVERLNRAAELVFNPVLFRLAASRLEALSAESRLYAAGLQRLAEYAEDIKVLRAENERLQGIIEFMTNATALERSLRSLPPADER